MLNDAEFDSGFSAKGERPAPWLSRREHDRDIGALKAILKHAVVAV